MKGFYDNMLPKEIGKYVKPFGGKVEKSQIGQCYLKSPDLDMRDLTDADTMQELELQEA
jgi:hypothetical protein